MEIKKTEETTYDMVLGTHQYQISVRPAFRQVIIIIKLPEMEDQIKTIPLNDLKDFAAMINLASAEYQEKTNQ